MSEMGRKKVRKQRGKRTHGWGSQKKHRGAGSRGGRGRAGITKHNKLKYLKQGIRVGKRGFVSQKQRRKDFEKCINLKDVVAAAGEKKEVDVTQLGYDKVLGKGKIEKAIIVSAKSFSAKAKEKIEQAGGKAISV